MGEKNPADLFTKHSLSRDRLMTLTSLFDCQFRGGRAESAPLLREVPSNKLSMADTCAVETPEGQVPFMPHLRHRGEELDALFPSLVVPEAVDAEDPQATEVEPLLEEGLRVAADIVRSVEEQGRRRRLAGLP